MKFGKQLYAQQAIPLFRGQFVAYRTLKNLINDIVKVEQNTLDPEVYATQLWWFDATQKTSLGSIPSERIQFIRLVENEISKTQLYYSTQSKMIKHALSEVFTRLHDEFELETIFEDLDAIAADLLVLERFVWQGKQLILKITKKHDKITRYRVYAWLLVRLEKEEFWNAQLDELVIGISDAYNEARKWQNRMEGKEETLVSSSSESFVRKNEKYFIKPEDVMLVKLMIVRHMPLDIFGRKMQNKPVKDSEKKKAMTMEALSGYQDAAVINSVYLDNKEKDMYHARTGIEGPKGNIIRVRWYGSHPNPPPECWMERKTRQVVTDTEYYSIDEAVKERFRIHERNVRAYMQGEWNVEKKLESQLRKKQIKEKDVASIKKKAEVIQEEIVSKHLDSSLRTVVRRSAFQNGFDQTLRFSIDSNLHIINENVPKEENKWARNMTIPLRLSEVVTLPYAILEIKTQKEAPEWVNDLKTSGYIIPSDHFSKFLYGTCKLWPNMVRFTPIWWERVLNLEKIIPISPPIAQSPLLRNTLSNKHNFEPNLQQPTERRKSQIVKPLSPQLTSTKQVSPAAIVVTPEMEREKATYILKTPALDLEGSSTSKKGKAPEQKPLTYSPFAKRRGETVSPRGSVQFDVAPPENHEELDFFFDQEGGGRHSTWNKVRHFFSSRFMHEDHEPVHGGNKNAKQRAIEQRTAKTFFANERTLLSWMNTATFLSLAGLTMINTQTTVGRVSGVGLTIITICFAIYALWKYMQRLYGLKGKTVSARLDDKVGPPLLILSFCTVLIILGVYFSVHPSAA
eukprot:Phypoly_transcript_01000.p1 GENE.Phypoly_transcript_01000~~Phypoly_transcript_01000.p1  ORF type:complete len:797 (+),score=119.30 Phypoly_transcript_01000:240-2630(+)